MVSSGSPVTAVVRLPISWVNSMARAFQAPEVSMTITVLLLLLLLLLKMKRLE